MRINIHATGFDLRPQLREAVSSRLLAALGSFGDRIQSVAVDLQARRGRHQPDTTSCEIVVTLRPSGEVRVRADDAKMRVSVDRAAQAIRTAAERELSPHSHPPASPRVTEDMSRTNALEIVLDGGRLSLQMREMLERPEHYLRPVRIREYWRPPGLEDAAPSKEIEEGLEDLVRR